jgi:hypothetical protein
MTVTIHVARDLLGDMVIQIGEADDELLSALAAALTEAAAELEQFASDITLRSALGDGYHRHLQDRAENVRQLRETYGETAREAGGGEIEISAEDLNTDDPELLGAALRGLWDRIDVRPG